MSLIKCPDCEQSISSNAKQCPHCGCAFQVCPECESILIGEHKICPECGFQLVKETAQPATETQGEGKKTLTQWYELSKFNSPFTRLITSTGFHTTLRLVSFILAAIAIIMVYTWSKSSDALSALVAYKDTLKTSIILLVLGALLWVATSTLKFFRDHISVLSFEKLVNMNNLNLLVLIEEQFKHGFKQGIKEGSFDNRINSVCDSIRLLQYKKDVFSRGKVLRGAWIQGIGSLIFAASCCTFVAINIENYMQFQFRLVNDAAFGFKELEYIWLPIAGVIIGFIVKSIVADYNILDYPGWMEENLPQHMADYKHYIVEYTDRYFENKDEQFK